MRSFRKWGLGLLASLALCLSFTPISYALERAVTYLEPGYMYAGAEARFEKELAYQASLVDVPVSVSTAGLLRDSHGFVQVSVDVQRSQLTT